MSRVGMIKGNVISRMKMYSCDGDKILSRGLPGQPLDEIASAHHIHDGIMPEAPKRKW